MAWPKSVHAQDWGRSFKLTNLHLVGSNRVFLLFSGSQRFQFFLVGHSSFLLAGTMAEYI